MEFVALPGYSALPGRQVVEVLHLAGKKKCIHGGVVQTPFG